MSENGQKAPEHEQTHTHANDRQFIVHFKEERKALRESKDLFSTFILRFIWCLSFGRENAVYKFTELYNRISVFICKYKVQLTFIIKTIEVWYFFTNHFK